MANRNKGTQGNSTHRDSKIMEMPTCILPGYAMNVTNVFPYDWLYNQLLRGQCQQYIRASWFCCAKNARTPCGRDATSTWRTTLSDRRFYIKALLIVPQNNFLSYQNAYIEGNCDMFCFVRKLDVYLLSNRCSWRWAACLFSAWCCSWLSSAALFECRWS